MKNKGTVVIKFKSRDLKNLIYCNKRSLKTVRISEHLSRHTLALRKKVIAEFPTHKVWTEECKIFVSWGKYKKCIPNEYALDKLKSKIVPDPEASSRRSSSPLRTDRDIPHNFHNEEMSPDVSVVHSSSTPDVSNTYVLQEVAQPCSTSPVEQLPQYKGIFGVFNQWNSGPGNKNAQSHPRADGYKNFTNNPTWRRDNKPVSRGRGQFIPKTGGRGKGNTVHVQRQGRGRGHFRGRGDFSGKGHFSGGGRGYNRFVSEKGGYYNSLYRNSNVNY